MSSGYLKRLEADLARWVEGGLLDARTAAALGADARAHAGEAGSALLPTLAGFAVLVGVFAVIGANWAELNGYARLGLLGALLFASLYGAGELRARGLDLASNIFGAIGAALVGGALVVVGQLYHTSATSSAFLSAWAVGASLVAIVVRSPLAGAVAAALAIGWVIAHNGESEFWLSGRRPIGPWLVFAVWLAVGWQAWSERRLGLVHLLAPGIAIWVWLNLDAAIGWGRPDEMLWWLGHAALFAILGAAAEVVARRPTPLWAARTIAGWCAWIAGAFFLAGVFVEQAGETIAATFPLIVLGLALFTALAAYGASPGRRWLRGAGVAGYIALAVIAFLEVDDLLLGGLVLIGFGVALTVLLLVTGRLLKARAAAARDAGAQP